MKRADLSKLIHKARKSLGLNGVSQQALLRDFMKRTEATAGEVAEALGKSPALVQQWLASEGQDRYRQMPEGVRLTLKRAMELLKDEK